MDGTIYDSANDIPDRPHPNCKCWIDVQEKEREITDPIEIHREKIKDRKREELELGKLLGDIKSLEEEIDEYIKQLNNTEGEIEKFENTIDTTKLEPKDQKEIEKVKEQIDYAKYKGDKAKQKAESLKNEIEKIRESENILDALDKIYFQYLILKRKVEEYIANDADKLLIDSLGCIFSKKYNLPEAWALYSIASPNLELLTKDYIQKNGKLYDSISDLHSYKLEKDIQTRLKNETRKNDCKVLLLNYNSSMAKAIAEDKDFKDFLNSNINTINKNGTMPDSKITFNNGDLYNAMHGAMVRDIKYDSDGNLIMRIEDLYNFEPNRTSIRGRTGERLQKEGSLENYYVITLIKIPKEKLPKCKN